jgi:hypothetical protein
VSDKSSYDSIAKWAREAKRLLRQGNLEGVKTNLAMILQQSVEEARREKSRDKRVFRKRPHRRLEIMYFIWWTSQADCERIGERLEDIDAGHALYEVPQYLSEQYSSRVGRNGRGRLWVAEGFVAEEHPWPKGALGQILERRAGILIREEDLPLAMELPGVVTDSKYERVRVPPASSPKHRIHDFCKDQVASLYEQLEALGAKVRDERGMLIPIPQENDRDKIMYLAGQLSLALFIQGATE